MGRLTLNVLLSFAQFEREVTGERIRDKIAASKKKGIWVGGIIPFGYRLENRKLLIKEDEAKIIRLIFERYLALGSIRTLEQELNSAGILTRRRELSTGKVIGGIPFTQGPIAHILKNRTYIGELNHRKKSYPADHAPIVSRELFDAVQKQLEAKRNARAQKHQASGALLIGKLFDQYGRPMTPTYACKGARRYRYYVSRLASSDPSVRNQPIIRARADVVEQAIAYSLGQNSGFEETHKRELIETLLERASLGNGTIECLLTQASRSSGSDAISMVSIPPSRRCKQQTNEGPEDASANVVQLDLKTRASLVRSIARGRAWLRELTSGASRDAIAIAQRENLSARSVQMTLALALLAPKIVAKAVEGKLPSGLGQRSLSELPNDWRRQSTMLE
jgi:hypothetical protein